MQKCQYLYKIIDNYWGKHNLPKLTPIKTESLSKPISRNKGFKFLLHKKRPRSKWFYREIPLSFFKKQVIKCCSRGQKVKENSQTSFTKQV